MISRAQIADLEQEIRELYLSDEIPWVIGFSGGKDSSAVTQIVWNAISGLPADQRKKPVHVISTDTLVENPVVVRWVSRLHESVSKAAAEQGMPFRLHRLSPRLEESFWVMLIGKGYAAPRPKFRWCTERLKINPSNAFIKGLVSADRGAILCLGTRKAESVTRARNMENAEKQRVRDRLSPNQSLPGTLVYTPIEDWSNDDVWIYLMNNNGPWGHNKDLLSLYRSASADNECPIVVDTSTPSCGASRFGCWTCTMVDEDKSLSAMAANDPDKDWMLPLIGLRDRLDIENDRHLREFTRMSGLVQLHRGRPIPGPYTEEARQQWLCDLLQTEQQARAMAPPEFSDLRLISDAELEIIQGIWLREKYELEDALPGIVEKYRGISWPSGRMSPVSAHRLSELRAACHDHFIYRFVRSVWGARLYDGRLDHVARRFLYRTADEATAAMADQTDLFLKKPDSIEAFLVKKAAAAAESCSPDDAPYVALAVIDRGMGRKPATENDAYIRTYYGD